MLSIANTLTSKAGATFPSGGAAWASCPHIIELFDISFFFGVVGWVTWVVSLGALNQCLQTKM